MLNKNWLAFAGPPQKVDEPNTTNYKGFKQGDVVNDEGEILYMVVNEGNIVEISFVYSGTLRVNPEQAENAKRFGWEIAKVEKEHVLISR